MVETSMGELVVKMKEFIEKWSASNQVECIDVMIAAWKNNNWDLDELT